MIIPDGLIRRHLLSVVAGYIVNFVINRLTGLNLDLYIGVICVLTIFLLTYFHVVSIDCRGKAVVITGCDSGFGHHTAKYLHNLGFTVFAACLLQGDGYQQLKNEGLKTGRLHVLQMDVTSDEQVTAAVEFVKSHLPSNSSGLWGIVNNAGLAVALTTEWCPLSDYEKVASVNLFGMIRTTKAFLPLIRQGKGRVINISSIVGRMAFPCWSPYCITKFGVEAFSDSLRLEMKQFQVKVSIIEPGNFIQATSIATKERTLSELNKLWNGLDDSIKEPYGKDHVEKYTRASEYFQKYGRSDITPVVNAIAESLYRLHPKKRYLVAMMSEKFVVFLSQHFPEFITDSIFQLCEQMFSK